MISISKSSSLISSLQCHYQLMTKDRLPLSHNHLTRKPYQIKLKTPTRYQKKESLPEWMVVLSIRSSSSLHHIRDNKVKVQLTMTMNYLSSRGKLIMAVAVANI
jgi:hypothetical protein